MVLLFFLSLSENANELDKFLESNVDSCCRFLKKRVFE